MSNATGLFASGKLAEQISLLEKRLQGTAALQEQSHWLTLSRIHEEAKIEAYRLDRAHGHNLALEERRHLHRLAEGKDAVINEALKEAVSTVLQTGMKTSDLHNEILRRTHETHSLVRERLVDLQANLLQAMALAKLDEDKAKRDHQRRLESLETEHRYGLSRDEFRARLDEERAIGDHWRQSERGDTAHAQSMEAETAKATLGEMRARQDHLRQRELMEATHRQGTERDDSQSALRRTEVYFTKFCDHIFDLLRREEDEQARRALATLAQKWREEGMRIIDGGFFGNTGTPAA